MKKEKMLAALAALAILLLIQRAREQVSTSISYPDLQPDWWDLWEWSGGLL